MLQHPTCILLTFAILALSMSVVDGQQLGSSTERSNGWYLKFRYGGGTPKDAGALGHCTATITKTGKVRIESKGRRGVTGPSDAVIYENEMLNRKQLETIFKAADMALKEPPHNVNGHNEDGYFLRLERHGSDPARIDHSQMNDFSHAPVGMHKFVELFNRLLPEKERISLARE